MASKVIQARVSDDLFDWVTSQGSMRDVVVAALEHYRGAVYGEGGGADRVEVTVPARDAKAVGAVEKPPSPAPQKTGLVRGGRPVRVEAQPMGAHGQWCQCIGCRVMKEGGA